MKHMRATAATVILTAALAGQAAAQQTPPPASPPSSVPPPAGPPNGFPPPPPLMWLPGIYLRADGGYGFSADTNFRDVNDDATLNDARIKGDSGSSPFYDVGLGGRVNRFLRLDVTASYMPSLKFSGTDNAGLGSVNKGQIRSGVALVNAYFDIPPMLTIFGPFVQPYLDFGVGAARNHVGAFSSSFPGIAGTVGPHSQTRAAAAVGVGVAISLGYNSALDLSYRFIDAGEIRTGSVVTTAGGKNTSISPIKADLGVNVLTAGLRFGF